MCDTNKCILLCLYRKQHRLARLTENPSLTIQGPIALFHALNNTRQLGFIIHYLHTNKKIPSDYFAKLLFANGLVILHLIFINTFHMN